MSLVRMAALALLVLIALLQPTEAASRDGWITVQGHNDKTISLFDARKPSLYTGDFGDCMGSKSLVTVTRLDAAFYKDNMTVAFHLQGSTKLAREAIMMSIGVSAYGEKRFQLLFNPCHANILSACPISNLVPIEARGVIPVSLKDIASIPDIALTIPDFEGQAVLRIFANSTKSQIGCVAATVTNGATFSHPFAMGSVLGVFTVIAIVSSFATAIYGHSVPEMRKHHARSMSVFVVFAVLQHIYFAGALSMNWPSVLVAFWSNYAWAGGMIFTGSMQSSIDSMIGENKGNPMAVGAAGTGFHIENLAGGYDLWKIYKKDPGVAHRWLTRALTARSDRSSWHGGPADAGLPLPGNYSGFAGMLSFEKIPASNAFMTGFLWLLIAIFVVVGAFTIFKWTLEGLVRINLLKAHRLAFFQTNWLQYLGALVMRTLFIAFFMMMFLTTFQLTYRGASSAVGLAAIIFLAFFFGGFALASYACIYRFMNGTWIWRRELIHVERATIHGFIPWCIVSRHHLSRTDGEKGAGRFFAIRRLQYVPGDDETPPHQDIGYITKFGWLAARYRGAQWYFSSSWLVYEFIRAAFYGGASGSPTFQVFGLLVVEVLAFVGILYTRPFESRRLNALLVYLLGISKVATTALSAAFNRRFHIPRVSATAIGFIIIVIHCLLTLALLLAIVAGAVTSWMSIMRDRPTEDFRPKRWRSLRARYFASLDRDGAPASSGEEGPEKSPSVTVERLAFWRKWPSTSKLPTDSAVCATPPDAGFAVNRVRRMPTIADEDPDNQTAELWRARMGRSPSATEGYGAPTLVSSPPDQDGERSPAASVKDAITPVPSSDRFLTPRRPRLERIDTGVEWAGPSSSGASRPCSDASFGTASPRSGRSEGSYGSPGGLRQASMGRRSYRGSPATSRSGPGRLSYGSLPRGAVPHRASWSMRDLE